MTPIAPHITAFFQKRFAVELRASRDTCDTYAYAFRLLLEFMSRKLAVAPADLALEALDAPLVLEFLEHLQAERHNSARTRNARLAAIRSFMRFVEHRVPSALDQVRRVRAIPAQRTDTRIVRHLTAQEQRAILDAPEPTTRLGIRDRAMLLLAVAGGLRVSELVGLRIDEVQFNGRYVDVRVRGKGRRERALTLWKSVGDAIRAWLAVRGQAPAPELFLNAWGKPMTRSGFERVLAKHVAAAGDRCPSFRDKRVSPHVLRHTCALNTLQATRDLRKVALWLGHASTQTTDIYLQADPTKKLEALAVMKAPALRPGKFRPPDRLIATLKASTVMRTFDAVNP
ncbi:tyrosine-type recombinase/integrase [Myxococcota bacterium]|nr:tyrosine-type recombinase/integrase [Myxococcota bacterium]MCZ7619580.1 site-specific integrase [Myxococcota bacterium]